MSPNEIDSLNAETLKGLVLSLLGKIDDLHEHNKAQQARIDQQQEMIDQQQARIGELLARIAELEGKPPRTPTNSSVPPSRGPKANAPGTKCLSGKMLNRMNHL